MIKLPYAAIFLSCMCFSGLTVYLVTQLQSVNASLNFTVVSYGLTPPTILSSLPLAGPGFDMGFEMLARKYGFNISHVYISPAEAVTCSDLADHIDAVSRYYYTNFSHYEPLIFVLPGCDDLMPLGRLAREWNVLTLSSGLSYEQLRNRRYYPTAINNGPMQLAMFAEVFVKIFDYFSWTSIAVLLDTGAMAPFFKLWPIGLTSIVGKPENLHITLQLYQFNSGSGNGSVDYEQLLKEVRKISRVVIISSTPKIVRNFMIEANQMGMTNGEYVYFALEPLRNNRYFGNLTWQYYDANDQIAMEGFRSLMQVAPCYNERLENDVTFLSQLVSRAKDDFNFTYPSGELPNAFAIASYESAEMLGKVINESMDELPQNGWDGRYLASKFLNRTFHLEYEDAFIDERGERRSNYCISSMNEQTKLLQAVLYYDARNQNISDLGHAIDWGNAAHTPPLNMPRCGYLDNLCSHQDQGSNISVIAGVLITSVVIIITGAAVYLIRKTLRDSAALRNEWWKIGSLGEVEFLQQTQAPTKSLRTAFGGSTIRSKSQLRKLSPEPVALYNGSPVWVTEVPATGNIASFPTTHVSVILHELNNLDCGHIVRLMGIYHDAKKVMILSEFCSRGSLHDLLETVDLDMDFRCSFLNDVIMGLREIHRSPLKYHGDLSLDVCMINSRFSLKIGYLAYERLIYGIGKWEQTRQKLDLERSSTMSSTLHVSAQEDHKIFEKQHSAKKLKRAVRFVVAEQRNDVAMFGRIAHSLLDYNNITKNITDRRSSVSPEDWSTVIDTCIDEIYYPNLSIADVAKLFKSAAGGKKFDVVTRMQNMMNKYAAKLEELVMERSTALLVEQQNCDKLLREILPAQFVEQLRKGTLVQAELFEAATIYFASLYGFQEFIVIHKPEEIAQLLNSVYTVLDLILPSFAVFKMETIADSYLVVSGIPERNGDFHAKEICGMALQFTDACQLFKFNHNLELKSGINTGPCAAGIVGYRCPRFCLFGDTVNTASRMESHGMPSRIHVSGSTAALILTDNSFVLSARGIIFVKGKGECMTYWLSKGSYSSDTAVT